MKVWITKYALTQGIIEKDAEECEEYEGMIRVNGKFPYYLHGESKEWCRTKESAIARAEEMRQKKIESLKKQIQKLKEIRFE